MQPTQHKFKLGRVYLVGGAVRDELLGIVPRERDWVVIGETPASMLALGFESVGKDFPVFLHPQTREEYALARTERKIGTGYHGFAFDTAATITLEEDLKRRDLTINAMAKAPSGEIIDPYGGRQDLANKVLRHVSDAFVEDPVRVLRVARFAARFAGLGFRLAPETLDLMKQIVAQGECDALVAERIWKEMASALGSEEPVVFIQVLRSCGALKKILPEIDRLYGVPQSSKWHPEVDTGIHIELVLKQATQLAQEPRIRFAALMHDVGKGMTDRALWPDHAGHEQAGKAIVEEVCERLRVPTDYRRLALLVTGYHGDYHHLTEKNADAILGLLEKLDVFRRPSTATEFMMACLADLRGRPGYETQAHPSQVILEAAWKAVETVDVQRIVASLGNRQGDAIKQAIREARLQAIVGNI